MVRKILIIGGVAGGASAGYSINQFRMRVQYERIKNHKG